MSNDLISALSIDVSAVRNSKFTQAVPTTQITIRVGMAGNTDSRLIFQRCHRCRLNCHSQNKSAKANRKPGMIPSRARLSAIPATSMGCPVCMTDTIRTSLLDMARKGDRQLLWCLCRWRFRLSRCPPGVRLVCEFLANRSGLAERR
jgi:hypothetical protein